MVTFGLQENNNGISVFFALEIMGLDTIICIQVSSFSHPLTDCIEVFSSHIWKERKNGKQSNNHNF
jgi:hypothetical protein